MSKRDSLGRRRHPNQDAALTVTRHEGRSSRSHNVSADPEAHAWFAGLTPQQRGDVIERAFGDVIQDA